MFFVIALVALALTITCFVLTEDVYVDSSFSTSYTYQETYGGDAYTGIQNASADAANNVRALYSLSWDGYNQICTDILLVASFAFLISTLVFIVFGVKKLLEAMVEATAENNHAIPLIENIKNEAPITESAPSLQAEESTDYASWNFLTCF